MAAKATFALKAGLWLRRVRLDMFPSCCAASSPQSGRESTYRPVQFCPATSEFKTPVPEIIATFPGDQVTPACRQMTFDS